ncbi:programmed cell death 1 ligand 1-like [Anomaloglossus baeobatrachus]|uniref:programmed cell death 1 ligand 1-like n=1 Tax=Anomaloglossus baeobatrachus TaxID=238106 RepID=UPI003F50AB1F
MAFLGVLLSLLFHQTLSSLKLIGSCIYVGRLGSDAWLPCLFSVDKPPVDLNHLTIFWSFLDKEILSYDKTVRTTSPRYSLCTEALLTGVADLTISNVQLPDVGTYRCSVIYNLERKEEKVLFKATDSLQEEIHLPIHYLVSCFNPEPVVVKWFRSEEKNENNIITGDPWRNPDKPYIVKSTVRVTLTEEDRKRIFSCSVLHKYLQELLQEDFCLVSEGQ